LTFHLHNAVPSFGFVFDNVQISVHASHHSRDTSNKFLIWTNAYAVRHRVQPPPASANTVPALDIPIATFLPCHDTQLSIQRRVDTIIKRILVKHVPYFEECKSKIEWHIPHQYSEASAKQSEIVSSIRNLKGEYVIHY
jgi:hypothetical protein